MKKIIAIVVVIVAITACFCIGAGAYESGETIQKGSRIVFNDTINISTQAQQGSFSNEITFECDGVEYTEISQNFRNNKIYLLTYVNRITPNITAYNDGWTESKYKIITVKENYSTENSDMIKLLNQAIILPPPSPINNALTNTRATFATTLTVATAIIAWLMANQIALVGLYMYILVALVATGKRFIKGV